MTAQPVGVLDRPASLRELPGPAQQLAIAGGAGWPPQAGQLLVRPGDQGGGRMGLLVRVDPEDHHGHGSPPPAHRTGRRGRQSDLRTARLMPLLSQATTWATAGGMPTASQPSGDRMSPSHPADAHSTLPNQAACRAHSTSRMSSPWDGSRHQVLGSGWTADWRRLGARDGASGTVPDRLDENECATKARSSAGPCARLLGGDPRRVVAAAYQVLELVCHVGIQRRHADALPAQVVDELACVPPCLDLVSIHRRSPSVCSKASETGWPVRTSTTPGTVRASPSSSCRPSGPIAASMVTTPPTTSTASRCKASSSSLRRRSRSTRISWSLRAMRRSRSRRATMPTTRSPATTGTDLRLCRSIIRAAAAASVSWVSVYTDWVITSRAVWGGPCLAAESR